MPPGREPAGRKQGDLVSPDRDPDHRRHPLRRPRDGRSGASGHDVTLLHRTATPELPAASHRRPQRRSLRPRGRPLGRDDRRVRLPARPGRVAARRPRRPRGSPRLRLDGVGVRRPGLGRGRRGRRTAARVFGRDLRGDQRDLRPAQGGLRAGRPASGRGDDGLTVIRPTYVDEAARPDRPLPWWVLRAARGGKMILPDPPTRRCSASTPVTWAPGPSGSSRTPTAGFFTAARPATTFEEFVGDTVAVVGEPVELTPVEATLLTEHGVDAAQLPLWSEGTSEYVLAMSTARAEAAGLTHGPSRRSSATRWRGPPAPPGPGHT